MSSEVQEQVSSAFPSSPENWKTGKGLRTELESSRDAKMSENQTVFFFCPELAGGGNLSHLATWAGKDTEFAA